MLGTIGLRLEHQDNPQIFLISLFFITPLFIILFLKKYISSGTLPVHGSHAHVDTLRLNFIAYSYKSPKYGIQFCVASLFYKQCYTNIVQPVDFGVNMCYVIDVYNIDTHKCYKMQT